MTMNIPDGEYELERQKIIEENQALLSSLGLQEGGEARVSVPSVAPAKSASRKRKERPAAEPEGPVRRSGRLRGHQVDTPALEEQIKQEEAAREEQRVASRKLREQVMLVRDMVEDTPPKMVAELAYLPEVAATPNPRRFPKASDSAKDAYADKDAAPAELQRLKAAFENMTLRANTKVTTERVFSMVVHPEPTKTLVFVGDKYGQLGIWDALGPAPAHGGDDDEGGDADEYDGTGRIWRLQAHARNSITCMKVDPTDGSRLYTSSYDCSLRKLDLATATSTEVFAFSDEDMLINHFDLTPSGQEAWMTDKNGGINHCDWREKGGGERRRWVVQEEGRGAKLGGISVNPLMPHLICTAGNDQHVRIWDVRHLSKLTPRAADKHSPPKAEEGDAKPPLPTHPTSSIPYEKVSAYMETPKGRGLLRASYQHGKSCSAAYWDPWGRRILTTSYDDRLRVWTLNPQSFMLDQPLAPTHFTPSKVISHNCQTGRWLTIFRAQWSLGTEYMPHFTIGNMKRNLDVFTATGERIVSLWADGVTAVPAVTASHPNHVDRLVGGNTSGRVQLWTSGAE